MKQIHDDHPHPRHLALFAIASMAILAVLYADADLAQVFSAILGG